MNAPESLLAHGVADWSAANQRWLAQRFAALRARIEGKGQPIDQAQDEAIATGFVPALDRIGALFGLSPFERELLLLAAGVELDDALARAVAAAQGRGAPGVDFAFALGHLPDAHWDAISPLAPLRAWRLVDADLTSGVAHALLRIDERVLHQIAGVAAFDSRLDGLARLLRPDDAGPADAAVALQTAHALRAAGAPALVLVTGRESAARDLALAVLDQAGLAALAVEPALWPSDAREAAECTRRLDREAALLGAGIAIALPPTGEAATPDATQAAALHLAATLTSPVLLLAPRHEALPWPGKQVVRVEARPAAPVLPDAAAPAQAQFRVEPRALQAVRSQLDAGADRDAWWAALREAARGGLDALAQRIDSRTGFDDLVLPPPTLAVLHEIAAQLEHRRRVFDDWGFGDGTPRGLGLCALFTGESGTGKTLAAEAIANALALDLYRIDLALVVSKYIGETEKNLKRVFDAAEASGAVLLFDEADALFGKRSEVKDSHDRYANIEVAYLLQRVEAYRGLAILTTNLKGALDRAFLRRLRFVVPFPFPDAAAREAIWRRQFPRRAPLGELDFGVLSRIHLPGGNIRAIAVNAAFAAARRGSKIEQALLMDAARAEFAKLERSFARDGGGAA